jgi:K+/H+ antiporter YhaU regulatory subunit KhtT
MEIQETTLPGVGLRHEFTTRAGRQLGVVTHRTGRRDLLVYDRNDPDACQEVIQLTQEEADALADLLGADRLVAATSSKLAVRYVHARAERLPFADDVFDLVLATLTLRHWTDTPAGIAEIGRVLSPGGVLVLADFFPSCRRRGPAVPMLRRRRAVVPAELGTVLAAHQLAVIGSDQTRWFRQPDVQVIAAQHPHQASANLLTRGQPPRLAT